MKNASHLIQRIFYFGKGRRSQMDIDGGGGEGSVSKISLDGQKISSVFIKMSTKSMAERMTGDTSWPPEPVFVFMNVPGQKKGIDRALGICLFRKEPSFRLAIFKPVLSKDI